MYKKDMFVKKKPAANVIKLVSYLSMEGTRSVILRFNPRWLLIVLNFGRK